ncbi:MAG TPA: serine/threonine-protein kinase [Verrucomicrobiota bacterium]|nr:serine/threonine-protein kinase [Verrucomicrobiota bacterium]
METKRICPSCHKTLPPDVPLGLCPECLIKSGFNTGTEPGTPGKASGFVPPPVEQIRKLFPQLEIIELIGQGGMGAVYKARQAALDRLVALKILPPGVAGDAGFAERFNREARALARLNHPHIVAVHDFGQVGGQPYLVMEFVDGPNLRQVEQAGRLTAAQALEIVPQICEALSSRTTKASSTATSSRKTSSSTKRAASKSPTSASRRFWARLQERIR